jgi:hypothetical protein
VCARMSRPPPPLRSPRRWSIKDEAQEERSPLLFALPSGSSPRSPPHPVRVGRALISAIFSATDLVCFVLLSV